MWRDSRRREHADSQDMRLIEHRCVIPGNHCNAADEVGPIPYEEDVVGSDILQSRVAVINVS